MDENEHRDTLDYDSLQEQRTDELTDLAAVLKSETKPNDVVFVKGSRALSLERLIPLLTEGDRDK